MEQAGIFDGLTVWVALGIAIGALGAAYAIKGHYSAATDRTTQHLLAPDAHGQVQREDIADALRQTHYGDRYLTVLEGGLARLERFYGPRRGRYALLLSIALALAYSWVVFFTLWGFGVVEGDLLGQQVLQTAGPLQLPLGLALAFMPLSLFFFFRWSKPRVNFWLERLKAHWAKTGNHHNNLLLCGLICGFSILLMLFLVHLQIRDGNTALSAISIAFGGSIVVAFSKSLLAVIRILFAATINVLSGIGIAIAGVSSFAFATVFAILFAGIISDLLGLGNLGFIILFFLGFSIALVISIALAGFIGKNLINLGTIVFIICICMTFLYIGMSYIGILFSLIISILILISAHSNPFMDAHENGQIDYGPLLLAACFLSAVVPGVYIGKTEQITLLLAFMVVLPLANGVADFVSLWGSRWFGGNLLSLAEAEDRRPGKLPFWIVLHMLGDLVVAAVTLTGLAFTISFVMQGLSHLRGYGFDVLGEVTRAAANWYTDGLWLTLLLFSTLLPTFAHLMALLFVWASLRGPRYETRETWAARLTDPAFDPGDTDDVRLVNRVAAWQSYGQGLWPCALSATITAALIAAIGYSLHAIGIAPADGIALIAEQGVAFADLLRDLVG